MGAESNPEISRTNLVGSTCSNGISSGLPGHERRGLQAHIGFLQAVPVRACGLAAGLQPLLRFLARSRLGITLLQPLLQLLYLHTSRLDMSTIRHAQMAHRHPCVRC